MAEPAPTRRSSRRLSTTEPASPKDESASRVDFSEPEPALASTPAPPGSRRAARLSGAASAVGTAPAAQPKTEPFELLEPVVSAPRQPEPEHAHPAAAQGAASVLDEFEAAARLFSFTGENPVIAPEAPIVEDPEPAATAPHAAPRRTRPSRGAAFKRMTAASFSVGVMGIVGLLAVGMTTPAEAVAAASGSVPASGSSVTRLAGDVKGGDDDVQAYVAPAEAVSASLGRTETYNTATLAQMAADSGIRYFSDFFVNNPNSPIQWPFAVGVPISYGFGQRDGEFHEGVDFTPGEGAPIQAIADGVVRVSTDDGGGYGVHIIIDHIIDGQLVSSHYAHMLYGSRQVQVGDHVHVGEVIGHTGDTGFSFGAHTHFEILMNGTTPIDPLPWLRQHAGG